MCDGIVLVFAHEETLCHLMKALADAGQQATRDGCQIDIARF